ncbi:glycosyltransferase family 1 protein [Ramaria rubella]|nr:glycosyltransferase family 1 protein [Ramaria rubella]KAF8573125.1 glycosyltransferase family 1 protein [Ramaria rubella]
MEPKIKYSGHILLVCAPGWGHLRPLCALAPKIVKERSDVAITFIVVGGFGQRVEREINRDFSGSTSDINLKENIRVVNLGGEGVEPSKLSPFLSKNFPAYYKQLLSSEPIQCLSSGKTFAAIREPTVVVIDFFLLDILRATRSESGTRVPIYAWQSTYSSAVLRIMGPEQLGGMGDVAAKARAQADATGGDVKAIASQLYRPNEGKLVTVSGIPAMYDYEFSPQAWQFHATSFNVQAGEDALKDFLFGNAYKFAQECDGFLAVSSTVYEPESLDGMRSWLSETNRSIYAIGPLTPPDSLSESSKKLEMEASVNGDEFQVFLDKQLKMYGDKSIIYISFGTFWWPKNEYVWVFVDVLLQLGIPFILSHPTARALIPPEITERIKESGLGLLSTWSPQQTILNHLATGWILTHCGQNSMTEALTQGIPMIAWPLSADQPINAAYLTLTLDVAFEMFEVRTGYGLKPLRRGVTPAGTIEAVENEARDIILRLRGPEGVRKRKNAELLRDKLRGEWAEGGDARKNLQRFLNKFCV